MEVPQVKHGWITDEQFGKIIRLSDELGEFKKGLDWALKVRTEKDAADYIEHLCDRFEVLGGINEAEALNRI